MRCGLRRPGAVDAIRVVTAGQHETDAPGAAANHHQIELSASPTYDNEVHLLPLDQATAALSVVVGCVPIISFLVWMQFSSGQIGDWSNAALVSCDTSGILPAKA
ncbi:hypothetical protein EJB05_07558, partial [Eragrostis curvula]